MLKLKKTDGGMYCFLVTFDLRSHTLNIIDVQAQHEAASIPMQAVAKQTLPERLDEHEPPASEADNDGPQQAPVPEVPNHKASRTARSSSTNTTESPLITREYRPNDLLSRREAAAYLGITAETLAVWQSTRRYNLPCVKVGRLARYRKADLDAFIQSRTTHKRMETKKHVEFQHSLNEHRMWWHRKYPHGSLIDLQAIGPADTEVFGGFLFVCLTSDMPDDPS